MSSLATVLFEGALLSSSLPHLSTFFWTYFRGLDNKLSIRRASIYDSESITEIKFQGWKTSYVGIIDQSYLDNLNYEDHLFRRKQFMKDCNIAHYVALFNEEIVGFCDAGPLSSSVNKNPSATLSKNRDEKGEIYGIYVLQQHQNKGIGSHLFQKAYDDLKDQGNTPALVWTLRDNWKARYFYECHGCTLVDESESRIGEKLYPEVAYRLKES